MQIFKTSKAKENILRKIRMAIQTENLPIPYKEVEKLSYDSFFQPLSLPTLEENFAQEFTKAGGHFVYCNTETEAVQNLKLLAKKRGWNEVLCSNKRLFNYLIYQKLSFIREFNSFKEYAPACITVCEAAIARSGSIILSSSQNHGRAASIYYPVHIVLLFSDQVVANIEDGIQLMKKKSKGKMPSMISLATGPSQTTSIENELLLGAQGPKEVFCFFLNNQLFN